MITSFFFCLRVKFSAYFNLLTLTIYSYTLCTSTMIVSVWSWWQQQQQQQQHNKNDDDDDKIRYDDANFNFCNSPPHHQFQSEWIFFCKLCYNHATMISTIWNYAKYSLATAFWWIQNSVEKKTILKTKMPEENARVFHHICSFPFTCFRLAESLEAVECAKRKSAYSMAFGGEGIIARWRATKKPEPKREHIWNI